MNKKLLTQIWNERQTNIALWLELLLISVALWYVTDTMYLKYRIYFQPRGFDSSHTYLITLDLLTEDSPAFDPVHATTQSKDISTLRERISLRPEVEAAGLSYRSTPYTYGSYISHVLYDTLETTVNEYYVSPEMVRVFHYQSIHGETPEELEALFRNGEQALILNGEIFREYGVSNENISELSYSYNPERMHKKAGQLIAVRRHDYMDEWDAKGVFIPYTTNWLSVGLEICVRVKPEQVAGFIERMWKEASTHYRIGNVFIENIESMEDVRRRFHRFDRSNEKKIYGIMIFLLFNVFIALFGVFWFRTRQRRREIALHMAMGANRKQIFFRLISEGIVLLGLATLPALLIDYSIVQAQLIDSFRNEYFAPERFGLTTGITFLLIASTIVCSILFPAFQATRIPPAEVLNEGE